MSKVKVHRDPLNNRKYSFPVVTLLLSLPLIYYVMLMNGSEELKPSDLSSKEASSQSLSSGSFWHNIQMPSKSFYGFSAPDDLRRWRRAQDLAVSGRQVILEQIYKKFPHAYDFLDGDIFFREIHPWIDIFVDKNNDQLYSLTSTPPPVKRKRTTSIESLASLRINDTEDYIPGLYTEFRKTDRAPLVSIGYYLFERSVGNFFDGKLVGHADMMKRDFLQQWEAVSSKINTPFIALYIVNENYGTLSTVFPNRTHPLGHSCCHQPWDSILPKFLNHDKTLMLIINQHHNYSHPKLLTLPRGLPIKRRHAEKLLWDAMRYALRETKKGILLYTAASKWHTRPQIVRCVEGNIGPGDFKVHFSTPNDGLDSELSRRLHYYNQLASARFGLALPGLGYDCFRTWELLMMGSIPVLERGIGLDRTLWRLPALLVEDFADITSNMLRTAYVEALYRVHDFEFERLTQSFWLSVIANVSISKSSQPLVDKFPMEAEDPTFTRPATPYACGQTNSCGRGTKRTPKRSC